MIARRQFVALLGGAAAWPMVARAQQSGGMRRIGVLTTFSDSDALAEGWLAAFRKGLDDHDWRGGRTIAVPPAMPIGCARLPRNWSRCSPTSSSPLPRVRPGCDATSLTTAVALGCSEPKAQRIEDASA